MTKDEKIDGVIDRASMYWRSHRKTEAFELLVREIKKLKRKKK